jgi:hypothetical protein
MMPSILWKASFKFPESFVNGSIPPVVSNFDIYNPSHGAPIPAVGTNSNVKGVMKKWKKMAKQIPCSHLHWQKAPRCLAKNTAGNGVPIPSRKGKAAMQNARRGLIRGHLSAIRMLANTVDTRPKTKEAVRFFERALQKIVRQSDCLDIDRLLRP